MLKAHGRAAFGQRLVLRLIGKLELAAFTPLSGRRHVLVTPAKRGKGLKKSVQPNNSPIATERRASMSWAQRLKRMFNIEIETCSSCGDAIKVNASIEETVIIHKTLDHLDSKAAVSN